MKRKLSQRNLPQSFNYYPDVLNVQQTAELLSVCPNTVYRLIRQQLLPCRRIGAAIRIRKSDVLRFMETSTEESHN